MRILSLPLMALIAMIAVAASGCIDEQRYIRPESGGPWAFAIDMDTPAVFSSDEVSVYLVEQVIQIPFREPTWEELSVLGDVGDLQIPYAMLPWLRRGDIEIQIDYTISNLSVDEEIEVAVVVNGMNEFHQYSPGIRVVDDDLVVDFSQWERLLLLAPGERRSGTIREEELDEVAVDLATVVNGAPNSNTIVHPQNQSALDPRSQMYIPDVVPALTGARVGMRAQADVGAPPPALLMEVTFRVRDIRYVLVQGDDQPWAAPAPALFTPIVPVAP